LIGRLKDVQLQRIERLRQQGIRKIYQTHTHYYLKNKKC